MNKAILLIIGLVLLAVPVYGIVDTDGLVFYWNLNDNLQDSVNGTNATIFGTVTSDTTQYIQGSGSYDFDGSDDYMINDSGLHLSEFKTINFWIYPDNLNNGQRILAIGKTSVDDTYEITSITGDKVQVTFKISGILQYQLTSDALPSSAWTMVTVTMGQDGGELFINGTSVDSNVDTSPLENNWIFQLGSVQYFAGSDYPGRIDEFSAWDWNLNSSELIELYNDGVGFNPFLTNHFRNTTGNFNQTEFTNGKTLQNITFTGTNNQTLYIEIPRRSDIYEGVINLTGINDTTFPENFTIEIGTPDNDPELLFRGLVNFTRQRRILDKINQTISGCSCTGCVITSNNCQLPITFLSDQKGIIQINDLYVDWNLSETIINVSLRDSTTDAEITTANLTLQMIGGTNTSEHVTVNGTVYTTFPMVQASETLSFRAFSNNISDYSIVIREINVIQGIRNNFTIYLTNTSDLTTTKTVTFHTVDQELGNLEGAIVHILQQIPSTGEFRTILDLTTNPNGEATTILVLDNVFYRWTVDYQGRRVFTLDSPVPITSNDGTIELICIVEDDYSDYWETVFNTNVNVEYNEVSNTSGYFTATFSGSGYVEVCQNVTIINVTGNFQQDYRCLNDTSGTITSSTFTSANRTTYCAKALIDPGDGLGKRYGDGICYIIGGQNLDIFGGDQRESLILLIVPAIFGAFGFVSLSVVGPLIMGLSYLIIFITGWTFLSIQALIILLCLSILSIFTIARIKK